uniref:Uncharacterized protein n=1 Tax=Clytia hemisphaerica TaxID=252671 RepID=A0A7M5XFF5_9CNID
MMSCLAGAIRRYLSEVCQKKPQDFPIAMTFNARSSSAKLADTIPLGNKSEGLFLSLPISVENPIERLDITRARLNKLKTLSHPHLFSFLYFSVIGGLVREPNPKNGILLNQRFYRINYTFLESSTILVLEMVGPQ